MADTRKSEAAAEKPAATAIVYKGLPPHGTEFLTAHYLYREDLEDVLKRQGMAPDEAKAAAKDMQPLEFHKDSGFKVLAADIHPEVLAFLDKDPAFRVERG